MVGIMNSRFGTHTAASGTVGKEHIKRKEEEGKTH